MPSFEVEVKQTIINTTKITIKAENEDAAQEAIKSIMDDAEKRIPFLADNKVEWDLDDEEYEVLEVNETND